MKEWLENFFHILQQHKKNDWNEKNIYEIKKFQQFLALQVWVLKYEVPGVKIEFSFTWKSSSNFFYGVPLANDKLKWNSMINEGKLHI